MKKLFLGVGVFGFWLGLGYGLMKLTAPNPELMKLKVGRFERYKCVSILMNGFVRIWIHPSGLLNC